VTAAEDLLALIESQTAQQAVLLNRAQIALRAPLSQFQGWYDHSAIRALCELLAGLLGGFESVAARNADAYMAEAVSITTGRRFQPTGSRRTPLGRIGVDNASVLGRITNSYRFQQSQVDRALLRSVQTGRIVPLPTDPQDSAFDRLDKIVGTNLQMAQRSQMLTTMAGSNSVTGYRRIIHPELATEGTCGLCIAASDRLYHKKELLPIHPGCHCTVLPNSSRFDPAQVNEIDFKSLYSDAGQFGKSTSAEALRQTRYKVDQHGEIGPVIRPADEPIRTKREARQKSEADRTQTLERKRAVMATSLNEFRAKRNTDPALGTPEWDAVESRLSARLQDLEVA
jgi:hypothetical protein